MPERIQRRRTKGWRMPEGARYVGRPTPWGNPFTIGEHYWAVDGEGVLGWPIENRRDARAAYCQWLAGEFVPRRLEHRRGEVLAALADLAGRDLACWCPLPAPGETDHCHAAVLLRLANTDSETAAAADAPATTAQTPNPSERN